MLVDILIVLAVGFIAYHGHSIGLVRQLLSAGGFLGGVFLGSLMQPFVIDNSQPVADRALLSVILTMVCAILFMSLGELFGVSFKKKIHQLWHLNKADAITGAIAGGVACLIGIWLLAPSVSHLPDKSINQSLQTSHILAWLNEELPPAPKFVAGLNRLINPNGFPDVFAGIDRQPLDDGTPLPDLGNGALQVAATNARGSVVKLEGRGCGGIVDGSGYVARPGIVITNAHVVAGVARPTVLDANGAHDARPLLFDPNLDLAVLAVDNLAGKPLASGPNTMPHGTITAVLGYPGGGSFRAGGASILDQFIAVGRDIYGQNRTRRDVYEIKANIIPGNSGGPLINSQGQVVGVVFAQSTSHDQVGYALSMSAVNADLQAAVTSNRTVATGSCAE